MLQWCNIKLGGYIVSKQEFREEELQNIETIVDEPWEHQFEKEEDAPSTRSARIHTVGEAGVYTKVLFSVIVALIVLLCGWLLWRHFAGGSAQTSAPETKVPKLVIQTTTTTAASTGSAAQDESSSSANDSEKESSKSSSVTSSTSREVSSSSSSSATQAGGAGSYTVVSGDNLYRIAQRYGTTVSQLKALNGLSSDSLKVGQVLRVK